MLELGEALLALLALLALVVALGRSSTARYEAERAQRARQQADAATQADAGALAPQQRPEGDGTAHPAGRGTSAWWLVDEPQDRPGTVILAGPFPGRMEADWAVVSGGFPATVQVVHGARRPDGSLVRRQSPQERAWLAELGSQLDRLADDWDELLSDADALTTLLVEVSAALVEAGLSLHDAAADSPAGGVCLTPDPARRGILVTWRQHDRMSLERVRGLAVEAAVERTMNAAIADVLTAMGFPVTPVGTSGCHLVAADQQSASAA
jgi:type II secretory pathway pseudopilin PulG